MNINKGSLIVGDFYTNQSTNTLKFSLGAGASYAYSTTGNWILQDLDHRPVVAGSAYAAGIGAQESAAHRLYQRVAPLAAALDRRALAAPAARPEGPAAYWIEAYGARMTREAGEPNSVRTAFVNHNTGLVLGAPLPALAGQALEAIVSLEHSSLDIESGNQKVASSSGMVGLLAPQLGELMGAGISARVLLGWSEHDGDRRVLNNTVASGVENVTAGYSSAYAVLGGMLTRHWALGAQLSAFVQGGADLALQRVGAYSESAYFAWDARTLVQLQTRLGVGLEKKLGRDWWAFGRLGLESRHLLSGRAQDYRINGTAVAFDGGGTNDSYGSVQLGAGLALNRQIQLFVGIEAADSQDQLRRRQASVGIRMRL